MAGPSNVFYIKQNDTAPSIVEYLCNGDGSPITDLASVRFHLRAADGSIKVNQPAIVLAANKVQYNWQAGDTNTSGMFSREWEITHTTGLIITVPNDENYPVQITDDIA